jgi:hypothetical protein
VQPGSDRAQLLEHPLEVDLKASKLGVETSGLRSRRLRKHPRLERKRDDPLLRPIVEIALDTPTRLVGGADDPHARGFQPDHACTFAIALATSAAKSARRASVSGGIRRRIE